MDMNKSLQYAALLWSPRGVALWSIAASVTAFSLVLNQASTLPGGVWYCNGVTAGALVVVLFVVSSLFFVVTYLLPSLFSNAWPWAPAAGPETVVVEGRVVAASSDVAKAALRHRSAKAVAANERQPLLKGPSTAAAGIELSPTAGASPLPGEDAGAAAAGVGAAAGAAGSCARRVTSEVALRGVTFCVCVGSVLALFVGAGIGAWLQSHTIPDLYTAVTAPDAGLASAAYLYRELDGVVHITASSEGDLFTAQGFAHAQLRMWQLEFQRRVGAGRLSEVVGSGGLDVDRAMRTYGLYASAQATFGVLTPRSQAALTSYAAGVNQYIRGLNAGTYPRPMEMLLLGMTTLEPWAVADSLVWAKLMSYSLAGNMDKELARYKLFARNVSEARIAQLMPAFNTSRFPTVLSMADLMPPFGPNVTEVEEEDLHLEGQEGHGARMLWQQQQQQHQAGEAEESLLFSDPIRAALQRAREVEAGVTAQRAEAAAAAGCGSGAGSAEDAKPARRRGGSSDPCSALPAEVARAAAGRALRALTGGDGAAPDSDLEAAAAAGGGILSSSLPLPALSSRSYGGMLHLGRHRRGRAGGARASNNWVVGGNWTASGLPLLCNDPHLGLTAPSIWILNHLRATAAGINVIGASFVGTPGVTIGRNQAIAWGVTNTGVDTQDLYVMTEQPGNASAYLYQGEYRAYETRTETIRVKDGADVSIVVRSSAYGPVVTDNGVVADVAVPLSLRWVATDPTINDTTLDAFLGLNTAASHGDFVAAMARYVSPSQNFVYADTAGNIAYLMSGYVPVRNPGANFTGAMPSPGEGDPAFEWAGRVPFASMPATLNPPEGFIASANNRVVPAGYSVFLTADWDGGGEGYRARSITEAVQAAGLGAHTVASMQAIQQDYGSGLAADIVGIAAAVPDAALSEGGRGLRARLVAWNKVMAVGSFTGTLWAELWLRLVRLAAPEAGQDYWTDEAYVYNALLSDATGTDPACITAGYPSCTLFLAGALNGVASDFALQSSGSPEGGDTAPASTLQQWGQGVHRAVLAHQVLDGSAVQCLADRSIPHGGDDSTINVGTIDLPGEGDDDGGLASTVRFAQTDGPSYRQVVDLSNLDGSLFVHPPGQDGTLLSNNYDSMLSQWAFGGYGTMCTKQACAFSLSGVIASTQALQPS